MHTPRRKSFKCAEEGKGGKRGLHFKHICVDIKRWPAVGFMGESNLCYSNIHCSTRRILMVIKQKVTVFPLSPAGDLHDTLVNVTHVGT